MMCIPCAEFQFCIHYIQLAFEKKMANMISKGGEGGDETLSLPSPDLWEATSEGAGDHERGWEYTTTGPGT